MSTDDSRLHPDSTPPVTPCSDFFPDTKITYTPNKHLQHKTTKTYKTVLCIYMQHQNLTLSTIILP